MTGSGARRSRPGTSEQGKDDGCFLVTFDLKDAGESSYESIYAWAHQRGGHRYFQFKDGNWGRLPSTTVVIPLQASNNNDARDEFRTALEKAGYNPT